MAVNSAAAINALLVVLDGELETLDALYAAIPTLAKHSPNWIRLTMTDIPAAHEAANETLMLLHQHQQALTGGQR